MKSIPERLGDFIEHAYDLDGSTRYDSWLRTLLAFVEVAVGPDTASAIRDLGGDKSIYLWKEYLDRQIGHLEALAIKLADQVTVTQADPSTSSHAEIRHTFDSKRVFLVHGHDTSAKESTARFLEKLTLAPVILHEQNNEGRTIIEKFEAHADVRYAVVLLTPDDVGGSARTPQELLGRARQNVILELGYFTGKLGRGRVCGLFRPGIEIPSDLHGVLFIELDPQGGWKTKLAQELVGAGMQIDLQGLLHG